MIGGRGQTESHLASAKQEKLFARLAESPLFQQAQPREIVKNAEQRENLS
jgi:hypothetical protein